MLLHAWHILLTTPLDQLPSLSPVPEMRLFLCGYGMKRSTGLLSRIFQLVRISLNLKESIHRLVSDFCALVS